MVNEAWVYERLDSAVFASLLQVVELAIPATSADAGAGRIYDAKEGPWTYVSAGRLGVPRQHEPIVHEWPIEQRSVFGRLGAHPPRQALFRPREVLRDPAPADQLFGPIEAHHHVADALAAPIRLSDEAWCLLMLFRCGCNPPFQPEEERRIHHMHDRFVRALRRGYEIERAAQHTDVRACHAPTAPTADTPPPADGQPDAAATAGPVGSENEAALLARLSATERRVLEYLRRQYTERQVGEHMERSPHTIHVHVKNIYRKLVISSRKQLLELFEGHGEAEPSPSATGGGATGGHE